MKKNSLIANLVLVAAGSLFAETRYFVSSPLTKDVGSAFSFVVPISDPEQINHARSLAQDFPIESGEGLEGSSHFPIIVIREGNQGLNRDFGRSNELWNWEVVELVSFYDFSINPPPISPLNPLTISLNLDAVLTESNGTGRVRFGGYTITGELPFQPSAIREDGSKESWFGTYRDDHFPWIRHETFGDLYVSGMDPENIWFWSQDRQSWFFTRESHGNFIYRLSDDTWLFRSGASQWFYNYTTEAWEFGAL
ncbi:MAG: hypothetical protein GVY36_07110 [Verrucomicrobia bacterium]|jgi:hypothetical protein|nr:hypothetical protein [Verrucomicrobiota bacterium]